LALYDQEQDPLEQRDLAAEQADEVERLVKLMHTLQATAEQHGKAFEPGAKVQHSEEEANQLNDLGYAGGDEDEDEVESKAEER
jgi:hypothetical protein